MLRFDGRVAVVTGAGAGLGRSYALLLAERGASVVVNDLGGARDGQGKSSSAADAVVNEIRAKGGKAVANYDSVEEGEKIIQTALDNFKRIDIVINNAGILRDRSFARISDQDWDIIHRVHVKGSFKTTQAAWPHFRKQNYGRIIMTSSNSGIFGNFGQANYSAAKLGLIGLANTIAIEGQKNNIHCNTIVPTAASRLTQDVLPPDLFQELKPELIAPVVAWLCHESCPDNGSVIEAAAGWAAKVHWLQSNGTLLRKSIQETVNPEAVRDNWEKVTDMSEAKHCNSMTERTAELLDILEEIKTNQVESNDKSIAGKFKYDERDVILYALGIGTSVEDQSNLRYLYENHENFTAYPSFLVIPSLGSLFGSDFLQKSLPFDLDLSQILHGEQYVQLLKPIPTSGVLKYRTSLIDVLDKGSNASFVINSEFYDQFDEKIGFTQSNVMAVNCGGFGGKRNSDKSIEIIKPPNREPDMIVSEKTSSDQSSLYRLSGDRNPLHIDPQFAKMAGFKTPIMHGLVSFGFSLRHVLKHYANNDTDKFKAIKARFASPVLPGQILKTEMWREGNRIHFETRAKETAKTIIAGGYVDLSEVCTPVVNKVNASNGPVAGDLVSNAVFDTIKQKVQENPKEAKAINGVFLYKITKNGKEAAIWTLDLKSGDVYQGQPKGAKADTTVTVDDKDFFDITTGKLSPQVAYMKGKLKIIGNLMLIQKLQKIMNDKSKSKL